jgi:hypothetical protein
MRRVSSIKIMVAAESRYLDKQFFVKLGPLDLGELEQLLMIFGSM